MIGSYKYITHETHIIKFTNSRKRASGFTPGVFQGVCFEVFTSFVHYFGIIIKAKCSPFNQGIIQQPIMSINKFITPMTEHSDPPSYLEIVLRLRGAHTTAYSANVCRRMRYFVHTLVYVAYVRHKFCIS